MDSVICGIWCLSRDLPWRWEGKKNNCSNGQVTDINYLFFLLTVLSRCITCTSVHKMFHHLPNSALVINKTSLDTVRILNG